MAAYVTALYEADQLEEARTQFLRFGDVIASTALPDYLVVAHLENAEHPLTARLEDTASRLVEDDDALGRRVRDLMTVAHETGHGVHHQLASARRRRDAVHVGVGEARIADDDRCTLDLGAELGHRLFGDRGHQRLARGEDR